MTGQITASISDTARSGSRIKAEPEAPPTTFFAGHPMLMSISGAPCTIFRTVARGLGHWPGRAPGQLHRGRHAGVHLGPRSSDRRPDHVVLGEPATFVVEFYRPSAEEEADRETVTFSTGLRGSPGPIDPE